MNWLSWRGDREQEWNSLRTEKKGKRKKKSLTGEKEPNERGNAKGNAVEASLRVREREIKYLRQGHIRRK